MPFIEIERFEAGHRPLPSYPAGIGEANPTKTVRMAIFDGFSAVRPIFDFGLRQRATGSDINAAMALITMKNAPLVRVSISSINEFVRVPFSGATRETLRRRF
jgi:hypothetical protein